MKKVLIVAAKRTPIGSFGGALKSVAAPKLGAAAIQAALEQAGLSGKDVDEVILGNVIAAGQGMGPGRQASILAGVPQEVPAYTVNMICGSGMKVVMDAAAHIKAGDAEVVVAAGAENMSQIPYLMSAKLRDGHKMGSLEMEDALIKDGLTDAFGKKHMGLLTEQIPQTLGITREQQDAFALNSQQRAVAAVESGRFADEIVPVEVVSRRQTKVVDTDEYPKADATIEKLAGLRAAFTKEGTITAGNASGLNDSGSAVILASEEAVERLGLTPIAELVSYAQAGVDPEFMGLGPVPAIRKALQKAELSLADMQLLEINEAFAGQALGVLKQLEEEHGQSQQEMMERCNMNGGAIALGHPLGASGNRILVTLLHEMQKQGSQLGLASLCVGGGMGTAVVVKRV
ncbi:acetyl-CoA C-acetyltransferase [Aliagarivorans marinus]|uniref:acetyl-CoA C-acetyltransferase n=1 Tax=Aliagarivorans marinus TaxID=561965 RepID=UPI00041AA144|nr:acetyl-CoA C-acetyltransferase [Aliagarivorans marinus]